MTPRKIIETFLDQYFSKACQDVRLEAEQLNPKLADSADALDRLCTLFRDQERESKKCMTTQTN